MLGSCDGGDLTARKAGAKPRSMLIYKILRGPEWRAFDTEAETRGAPVDLADGFIHFSTAQQAAETAAKHFPAEHDLWLVAVESDRLGEALRLLGRDVEADAFATVADRVDASSDASSVLPGEALWSAALDKLKTNLASNGGVVAAA